MKNKLTLMTLVAATVALLSTGTSQARGQNNVVRLAHDIERIAKDLKKEFQSHYRGTREFRHLMTDVNDVIKKADHIDELAHNPRTSYQHIKKDLAELDKLAHHLHAVVDRIDSGCTGNLNHVHAKLGNLNNTIHQMERAIIVYAQPEPTCGSSNGHYSAHDARVNRSNPHATYNSRSRNTRTVRVNDWRSFGNSALNSWLRNRF